MNEKTKDKICHYAHHRSQMVAPLHLQMDMYNLFGPYSQINIEHLGPDKLLIECRFEEAYLKMTQSTHW